MRTIAPVLHEMSLIRFLFIADTHLGFDYAWQPRVKRRRRGDDFWANYRLALKPAFEGRVDAIVHGGDLLYRSKVPPRLTAKAFEPLLSIADSGIPIYITPGNHERSAIPHPFLAVHKSIHIFRSPESFIFEKNGIRILISGWPYYPRNVRHDFLRLIEATGWYNNSADVKLLCLHHLFEGASVGPNNYVFRSQPDVIKTADLPADLDAVLTGHIHRAQILTHDLKGNPLSAPIFYPGSIERTSFAEKDEDKGYFILEINPDDRIAVRGRFMKLPARPMHVIVPPTNLTGPAGLRAWISRKLAGLPGDSVVNVKLAEGMNEENRRVMTSAWLRQFSPETMTVNLQAPRSKR